MRGKNKKRRLKIIACIQARIGSARLKGKVLKKVLGKTIVEHIFHRLKASREIDDIVLSTSTRKENDVLVKHARRIGLKYYRGGEKDLVSRLYKTILKFRADALVRVTGDCPLVDSDLVDKLTGIFRKFPQKFDYLTNIFPRTFPDGLDIELYPLSTLKLLFKKISKKSPYRENFPSYILENSKTFHIFNLKNKENLSFLRLTVDYQEDLELISEIFKTLGKNGKIFKMRDIIKLLKKRPNLIKINQKYAIY